MSDKEFIVRKDLYSDDYIVSERKYYAPPRRNKFSKLVTVVVGSLLSLVGGGIAGLVALNIAYAATSQNKATSWAIAIAIGVGVWTYFMNNVVDDWRKP